MTNPKGEKRQVGTNIFEQRTSEDMSTRATVNVVTLGSGRRLRRNISEKSEGQNRTPYRPVGVDSDQPFQRHQTNWPAPSDEQSIGPSHRLRGVDMARFLHSCRPEHCPSMIDSSPEADIGPSHRPTRVDLAKFLHSHRPEHRPIIVDSSSEASIGCPYRPIRVDAAVLGSQHRPILVDSESSSEEEDPSEGEEESSEEEDPSEMSVDGPEQSCNVINGKVHISNSNFKKFEALIASIPESLSFKDAWKWHPLAELFEGTDHTIEEIEILFRDSRISRNPALGYSDFKYDVAWYYREISGEKLSKFHSVVRKITRDTPFEHALPIYDLASYFRDSKETLREIKEIYWGILEPMGMMFSRTDSDLFRVPCTIRGFQFDDALCDSGASINVMSKKRALMLGIGNLIRWEVKIGFPSSNIKCSEGIAVGIPVWIEDRGIPTNFHIIDMKEHDEEPIIFGSSFLATVGAVMDWPNKRMSFTYVNQDKFYQAIPASFFAPPVRRRLFDKPNATYAPAGEIMTSPSNPPNQVPGHQILRRTARMSTNIERLEGRIFAQRTSPRPSSPSSSSHHSTRSSSSRR